MPETGVISQKDSLIESIVEWSIQDFLSLLAEDGVYYDSPVFSFANESWYLRIFPNGRTWARTEGHIELFLFNDSYVPRMDVEITLGVKTVDGKIDYEEHYTEGIGVYRYSNSLFLSRSELLKRKSDLLPSDTLILVCRLKIKGINEVASSSSTVPTGCAYCNKALAAQEDIQCHLRKCEYLLIYCQNCSNGVSIKNWHDHKCQKTYTDGSSKTVTTNCFHCNKTLDSEEDIQSHLEECDNLPIKCRKCNDRVALKNWYEHECQMTNTKDDCVVCQDFKKMLSDGQNHDLTLKVGDKELRAHQDVLKSRCRVFDSMLNHDTAEKKSGVIDIPDCDPQAIEQLLLYVYCGKVETLDEKNMLGLYYVADKYDMQDLKQKCCDFIKKSLSHTNICKIIQLALSHSDAGLLEHATEYFMDNTVKILFSVEWQNFLKDNTTVANELLIKSFEKKEQQIMN